MKYKTLYVDPPWMEVGGGKIKRGADRHYPLMPTKDICKMPVHKLIDDNCHLYLWVTNNFLEDGLRVIKAWGFEYKTMITWAKIVGFNSWIPSIQFGLGQYFRGATEHCLFAVKGNLPYKIIEGKRQQGKTLMVAPRNKHSEKPEEMRQMIETVSYSPYLELFARKGSLNWDTWGNEIESIKWHDGDEAENEIKAPVAESPQP